MIGFSYNAVTCINIVFSIGLAVDFTMHITHAYLHSSGSLQVSSKTSTAHDTRSVSFITPVSRSCPLLASSNASKRTYLTGTFLFMQFRNVHIKL